MDKPTEKQSRFELLCLDKNLRMTVQRRVIARVLSSMKDHPDVEELHRRVSEFDNRISLSTVYRTVRLFESIGILKKHDFGEGRARYERATEEHHDHLIDLTNGQVVEFKNKKIEHLQELIARELGYQLIEHKLELFGIPLRMRKLDSN